jgi:hypothetical protein
MLISELIKHNTNTQTTYNKYLTKAQKFPTTTLNLQDVARTNYTQHITVRLYTCSLLSPSASVLSLKPAGGSRQLHPSEI